MSQNKIVVLPHHDTDNDPICGCIYLHRVVSCDVEAEKATVIYDCIIPSRPGLFGPHPSGSYSIDVNTLEVVGDDVLDLLEDRGVNVIYQN